MASIDLTKLQPGKTYNVSVRALDSDGNYSGYSVVYSFTTPTTINGKQLTSINNTVVTGFYSASSSGSPVGGALTAGGLDANGLQNAGGLNLADVWNSGSAGYVGNASVTGTASAGAVIINSTGIMGYQFGSASVGQPSFFLNTYDGNAYFRGTIYAGAGLIGGWTVGSTALTSTNVGLNSANSPQVPGSTTSSNLLTNPGFETGTTTGWSGALWGVTISNPRSGSYSINYGPNNPPALTQTVAVIPSFVYDLSIWARMGTSTAPSSSLSITWIDSSSNTISSNTTTFTITSTYSQFSLSGIVAPTNAASAIISITPGTFTANGVYVDDTSFTTTNSLGAVSIYSGSSFANATQAPFIVTNTGNLIASSASISGNIVATSGSFTGMVTAQSGSIGGFIITSSSLYAGSTGSFVGIIPASLPFFAGAIGFTGAGSKFSVSNTGAITSTLGTIGSWTISSDNIRSNTFGSNIILSSASNSISFTGSANSIISNIVSGSSSNPLGNLAAGEGLLIYTGSVAKYDGTLYPQISLVPKTAGGTLPVGTYGYLGVYGSASTSVEMDDTNLYITANTALNLKSANSFISLYATSGGVDIYGTTTIKNTLQYDSNIIANGRTSSGTENVEGAYIGISAATSFNRNGGIPLTLNRITGTTNAVVIQFYRNGTGAGQIQANTSTAPSFVAPSDYRLKENIQDYVGAIEVIKKIKPRIFSFKNDESKKNIVGFIAHEYAEVNPEWVNGEKDALDKNGNPEYQSIDTTSIITYLAAALKESIEKIENLENRIALLENK